ncbi:MAG: four helix bundle protein [Peptococcaceae bacterium]|nr:four helix bundle protein [Peptococcaceae bacterium]
MELAVIVYRLCEKLPKAELYSLQDQMKRAAVSIPSNIAEGQARGTREFIQFLRIARGSRAEVETQLLLCVQLKFLSDTDIESALNLLTEISKMTATLIKNLSSQL